MVKIYKLYNNFTLLVLSNIYYAQYSFARIIKSTLTIVKALMHLCKLKTYNINSYYIYALVKNIILEEKKYVSKN